MSPIGEADVPREVRGLRIAVLVSGGIAAYKVADLVSRLVQAGCEVRVAMTAAAREFVGPSTFSGLTGNPVEGEMFTPGAAGEPHVEIGDWAQLLLAAPATADLIAHAAQGEAPDAVTAAMLAARCPLVMAPAMNDAMWEKEAVARNVALLRERGVVVVEPEVGRLASGRSGVGRLAGPAAILAGLAEAARSRYDLAGRRVLVTAGGTREPIDPVRFISNYSSGKMGFALASAAAERGASVTLVTSASHPEHPGVEVARVETAGQMLAELRARLGGTDVLVMAAAVADYRPAAVRSEKIRREQADSLVLDLERNVDILAELAAMPQAARVFRIGFAAEDSELEAKGREKLARKGLDAIVANDISRTDRGLGSDFNGGVMIFRGGALVELPVATKREMAERIWDLVRERLR